MKTRPSEFKLGKCYYFYHDEKQIFFILLGINKSEFWDRSSTRRLKVFINGELKDIICFVWEEYWSMEK